MNYLTFEEFKQLAMGDVASIDESVFLSLYSKAAAVLDDITHQFYARHDFKEDNPWRIDKFKKALVVQIEYFYEVGSCTFEGINASPQSFSAGRTSVSVTSRYNPGGKNESKPLVAEDVFIYLRGTGLLFSGVDVV